MQAYCARGSRDDLPLTVLDRAGERTRALVRFDKAVNVAHYVRVALFQDNYKSLDIATSAAPGRLFKFSWMEVFRYAVTDSGIVLPRNKARDRR